MPSIVRFVFNEVSAQCVALLLLEKDHTLVGISKICPEIMKYFSTDFSFVV